MVSSTNCPYVSVCGCEVVRGAAAPKGPMTYAVFVLCLKAGIRAWRLGFELRGWDFSFKAEI